MKMSAEPTTRIGRMTGVEANAYVNVPTVSTVGFQTKELCDAAVSVLQKQGGVYSVSCVQTEGVR